MARSFLTAGDMVALPSGCTTLDQLVFSLIVWFKDDGNGWREIFTDEEAFNESSYLRLRASGSFADGLLEYYYRTPTGIAEIRSSSAYDDGAWHWCFVVRRATNDFEAYVDGTSVGTSSVTCGTATITASNVTIGNWYSGGPADEPFGDGLAHFVLFRGTALTVAEATEIAYGNFGRKVPTAYLPLWGESTTEPDYSPNAYNGTVTGTAKVDHPGQVKWRTRGRMDAPRQGSAYSLSAAAAGAATAGSADNAVRGVYATAAGAAIASASDNVVRALGTVTVAGTGAAAAPMNVVRVLQATASGAATATATFSGTVRSLSATVTSVSTAAATMAAIRAVLAQAAGAGVAAAQVSRLAIREAAAGGLSTAAANVALIRSLGTIQAAGSASASAAVNVIRALSALAAAAGVAEADLDIAGAAAATSGKYAAEHAQAYRMVLAAEQDDYTSEHARAYRDVFEAGA